MAISINKYLFWHLFAGTKGGPMRMKIIKQLQKQPMNTNQLTKKLSIDYKTAKHHLNVLAHNRMIQNMQTNLTRYGSIYHVSGILEEHMHLFNEIWEKVNKYEKGVN